MLKEIKVNESCSKFHLFKFSKGLELRDACVNQILHCVRLRISVRVSTSVDNMSRRVRVNCCIG